MSQLLDTYNEMLKVAADRETLTERVSILEKYAGLAETELQKNYPNNFTKEDVVELADQMIQHDINIEEQQVKQAELLEKIAELDEAGRIMARSFWDESLKLNAETNSK
jgi:hypothetical protein